MINKCILFRWSVIQLSILLFVLLSCTVTYAQKFTLGVKAGGSLTWAGFGDKEAKDTFSRRLKPGFNAAALIGFPLKNDYSLFIDAGASQKGRILTFNEDPKWTNSLTMNMLDMSMWLRRSFKFNIGKNIPGQWFVAVGPEINYWLNSHGYIQAGDGEKYKYDVQFGTETEGIPERNVMTLKDYNRWLFSLGLGVGMRAPLTPKKFITTELRFLSGHTFLGKANSSYIPGIIWADGNMQDTMKTNLKSLTLTVAYTVDFDRVDRRKGKSTVNKRLKK